MKKVNERNAGRKRHGKELKVQKSICLPKWKIDKCLEFVDNFSELCEGQIDRFLASKGVDLINDALEEK